MYRKTKYIQLNSGKSTLALEPSYWHQIEYLAHRDGYGDWRDWFYANRLFDAAEGQSVAAYVRMKVSSFLYDDLRTSGSNPEGQSNTTGIS